MKIFIEEYLPKKISKGLDIEKMEIYPSKCLYERCEDEFMRDEYDFSNGVKNPYVKPGGKTMITIRLDDDVFSYFKALADKTSLPYQTLIHSYLADCVRKKKKNIC